MKKLLASAMCLCLAAAVRGAMPADEPFQASLTPDIAIYPPSQTISGLTLSIWGQNPQHSLALGFVNGTSGHSSGLSIGLINYGDDYLGVQWAFVNYDTGDFLGWQKGVVNFTTGKFTGFQLGIVNYAGDLNGFQLGVVNIADKAAGLQIGIVNIIAQNNAWFTDLPDSLAPAFIIANWRF